MRLESQYAGLLARVSGNDPLEWSGAAHHRHVVDFELQRQI